MIYISFLLDIFNIILSMIIINFLYRNYINSEVSRRMNNNIENLEVDNETFEQIENQREVDNETFEQFENEKEVNEEIIYALPPEENIEPKTEVEENINNMDNNEDMADANIGMENGEEEFKNIIVDEDVESLNQINEPTSTLLNDKGNALTHSSLIGLDILETVQEENEVSRRRKLALKISGMNSNK